MQADDQERFSEPGEIYVPRNKPPRESAKAREAYADFVAMGQDRSLTGLIRKYQAQTELGYRTPTTNINRIKHWSSWYRWRERIDRLTLEAAANAEQAEKDRLNARRENFSDRVLDTCEQLLLKAQDMLKFPLTKVVRDMDGQPVEVYPAKWNFDTPARMIDTATKLYNLAEQMRSGSGETSVQDLIEIMSQELGLSEDGKQEALSFAEGYLKGIRDNSTPGESA